MDHPVDGRPPAPGLQSGPPHDGATGRKPWRTSRCSGTGLIGLFYTMSLHGKRSRDRVVVVQGRDPEKTKAFAEKHGIPRWTTSLEEAVSAPDVDLVVVGLPEPPPPRGGHRRRPRGQGHPLHQAPRPHRGRGEGDARGRGEGRRLPRLPRGPRLHAEDAEGPRVGPQRRDRPRALDPLARGAPRAAQRLVLDEGDVGRRRHRRHGLPLHRDRPQLRGQGRAAGRGRVLGRDAGAPDRGRGLGGRPRALRERRRRAVRGGVDVPRGHGPARRGLRQRRHDLAQPLAAHGLRDVLGAGVRRLRRGEGGDRVGLALPGGRRAVGARLRRHVRRHARRLRREARAGRDLLRRLRRQRDHGRLLPLDGDEAVGAGRPRRLARSGGGAGRGRRTSSTTRGTGSSSSSGCRTGARSSS